MGQEASLVVSNSCFLVTVYPKKYAHGFCNLTIAPVPAKQPWWIWINTSCEFIMNDCITTTKQSTTKACAYFLGYTVHTYVMSYPTNNNLTVCSTASSVYRKTSDISRTLVGNKIVDNSDVVGAPPVGAAPTTSSFSTWHLASMDWAKTTARGYKKHLSCGIWCDLYKRFDGSIK